MLDLTAFWYLNYVQRLHIKMMQYENFHVNSFVHRSDFLSDPVYTATGTNAADHDDHWTTHIRPMVISEESFRKSGQGLDRQNPGLLTSRSIGHDLFRFHLVLET